MDVIPGTIQEKLDKARSNGYIMMMHARVATSAFVLILLDLYNTVTKYTQNPNNTFL